MATWSPFLAVATLAVLMALPVRAVRRTRPVPPRPNILWILTEDASPDLGA